MMKAIIFGINGQDGFYLNKLLLKNNITVIGVSRSDTVYLKGDVSESHFVKQLIKNSQPDYVFHLAANSATRHDSLIENYQTITTGTLNILEAVYQYAKKARVFISGSGLQFVNTGLPIAENHTFEARDGYSMARIQSVYAARYYRSIGVKTYIGYFFNHDSPLRTERHVNQKIIIAAKRICTGSKTKLVLGNVDVKKEFTFAGDVVKAMWMFINNDIIFETVIGSGEAYPISHWLTLCFGHFSLNWKDFVIVTDDFSAGYQVLVSKPDTLYSLGWRPQVEIDELAAMMLKY